MNSPNKMLDSNIGSGTLTEVKPNLFVRAPGQMATKENEVELEVDGSQNI